MLKLKSISKKQKAVTILEVLIAFFVIAIGLTSVLSLFVAYYISTTKISKRTQALFLAQEGLEMVRAYRDILWENGEEFDLEDGNYVVNALTEFDAGESFDIKQIPTDETNCFEDLTEDGCRLDIGSFYYHYTPLPESDFGRIIKITKNGDSCGGDCYKIESIVIWKQGSSRKKLSLVEYLYDWKR